MSEGEHFYKQIKAGNAKMKVEECYKKMNADYEDAIYRIGSDERIIKYLKLFQRDTSLTTLCEAIDSKDMQNAFYAVHTLKGVALNLSMTVLADNTKMLTEVLRNKTYTKEIIPLLQKTKEIHAFVMECIDELITEQ